MKELSVELNDRILRFDGVSIVPPEFVADFFLKGLTPDQLRLSSVTNETESFNAQAGDDALELNQDEPISFQFKWQVPSKYLELNIEEHVSVVFGDRLPGLAYNHTQTEQAITRVARELEEFSQRGLDDLLRVIIYVLDRFRETGQVYGVGRGSSCASFVLFLLGLHVVDSIKFNVPLEEFFHD